VQHEAGAIDDRGDALGGALQLIGHEALVKLTNVGFEGKTRQNEPVQLKTTVALDRAGNTNVFGSVQRRQRKQLSVLKP
jgi:hypothetical protein